MQTIRWITWIIGIVLAIALALQNNTPTAVELLWAQRTLPLSVLLIVTLGIGFLFGSLMTAMMLRRQRKQAQKVASAQSKQTQSKPAQSKPAEPVVPTERLGG